MQNYSDQKNHGHVKLRGENKPKMKTQQPKPVVIIQETDPTKSYYQSIFQKADVDKTGTLTKEEFKQCFKELGIQWTKELDRDFNEFDSSRDGEISYEGNVLELLVPHCVDFWSVLELF